MSGAGIYAIQRPHADLLLTSTFIFYRITAIRHRVECGLKWLRVQDWMLFQPPIPRIFADKNEKICVYLRNLRFQLEMNQGSLMVEAIENRAGIRLAFVLCGDHGRMVTR